MKVISVSKLKLKKFLFDFQVYFDCNFIYEIEGTVRLLLVAGAILRKACSTSSRAEGGLVATKLPMVYLRALE